MFSVRVPKPVFAESVFYVLEISKNNSVTVLQWYLQICLGKLLPPAIGARKLKQQNFCKSKSLRRHSASKKQLGGWVKCYKFYTRLFWKFFWEKVEKYSLQITYYKSEWTRPNYVSWCLYKGLQRWRLVFRVSNYQLWMNYEQLNWN